MSILTLEQQIISDIDRLLELDLTKLYPDNVKATAWHNMERDDIEKFTKDTVKSLEELKNKITLLDVVGYSYVSSIQNHLEKFISDFKNVRSLDSNQIINQHHAPLNQLNGINNILRSSGLYTEIKFNPNLKDKFEEISKIEPILKRILNQEDDFNKAIDSAREWLNARDLVNKKIIEEHAQAFLVRADEHKIYKKGKFLSAKFSGNWWWLFGGFIFSIIVAYVTHSFIQLSGEKSISTGQTILRISSLLVPAYLTVFCSSQFLYHKRMYESYMFKFASLNTMNNLISTHGGNSFTQEKIFEKGLNVLFSEPTAKDDRGKYDKQLVTDLLGILKNQINK